LGSQAPLGLAVFDVGIASTLFLIFTLLRNYSVFFLNT
jgi:hypothetical protein